MSVIYKNDMIGGFPDIKSILDTIFPLGSIFVSIDGSTCPGSDFGLVWTQLATGTTLWNTDEGGGTTIAPSLPKLYGERHFETTDNNGSWSVNGVFSSTSKQDYGGASGGGGVRAKVIFDSSKGNSIYSGSAGSDVVRPNSTSVKIFQRTS